MELIAECWLWFGPEKLALPSAISLDANLMGAAKRQAKTEVFAQMHTQTQAGARTQIKHSKGISWQTVICVGNSVP